MLSTFLGVLAALLVLHQLTTNGAAAAALTALGVFVGCGVIDSAVLLVKALRARPRPPKGPS